MVRGLLKTSLSPSLRFALREVANEWRNQRVHRASSRRASQLSKGEPIRLNLGSGRHPKPGWVNVDLFDATADLHLDLREPFPFASNSAVYIYTEHFFEHLNYPNVLEAMAAQVETADRPSEARGFLRECWRVLVPGGVLDIVVPDAERKIGQYVNRHTAMFPIGDQWWGPKWCDTPMHCVNYLFRQGREHKYAYDFETLSSVLESIRFVEIRRRPFDPTMDAPDHVTGSLSVVAKKSSLDGVGIC